MGIIFHWFKGYDVRESQDYHGTTYFISLINHHTTEHSAGNVIKIQELFDSIIGKVIPTIDTYSNFGCVQDVRKYLDSILIDAEEMIKMCNEVLANPLTKDIHMEDRVLRFKELSDYGYYIAYDAAG